jgi:hypothetical protein
VLGGLRAAGDAGLIATQTSMPRQAAQLLRLCSGRHPLVRGVSPGVNSGLSSTRPDDPLAAASQHPRMTPFLQSLSPPPLHAHTENLLRPLAAPLLRPTPQALLQQGIPHGWGEMRTVYTPEPGRAPPQHAHRAPKADSKPDVQGQGHSPAGMPGHYHAPGPFMSAKLLVYVHRKGMSARPSWVQTRLG